MSDAATPPSPPSAERARRWTVVAVVVVAALVPPLREEVLRLHRETAVWLVERWTSADEVTVDVVPTNSGEPVVHLSYASRWLGRPVERDIAWVHRRCGGPRRDPNVRVTFRCISDRPSAQCRSVVDLLAPGWRACPIRVEPYRRRTCRL